MAIVISNETHYRIHSISSLKQLIRKILSDHSKEPGSISFLICNDEKILSINREFLKHDYYTDIITFPMSDPGEPISADIIISIDTVTSNAVIHNTTIDDEFLRVCVHGILHLCGYNDSTTTEKTAIRSKEDYYINK